MKRLRLALVFLGLIVLACPSRSAQADGAPPEDPSTTGIIPYFEYQATNVRMLAENVRLTLGSESVAYDYGPDSYPRSEIFTYRRVAVSADFKMRNLGALPEEMKVMFPLQTLNCDPNWVYFRVVPASFRVAVDGIDQDFEEITTDNPRNQSHCASVNWAAFLVDFPIETNVFISVSYTMRRGEGPYQTLDYDPWQFGVDYVLETGAPWKGTIGSVDITFDAGYPLDEENAWGAPAAFSRDGNTLHWHMTDLEPTAADNIQISVINPDVWNKVLPLRAKLRSDPEDARAWYDLGSIYSGLTIGNKGFGITNLRFANLAEAALAKAVLYGPDVVQFHSGYADLLGARCTAQAYEQQVMPSIYLSYCYMTVQEAYKVWDLDPIYAANQNLGWVSMIEGYQDPSQFHPTATQVPSSTSTRPNTRTPTLSETPRPPRDWTPVPTPTRNPSLMRPTATLFLTPIPTASPQSGFATALAITALIIAAGSIGMLLYLAPRLRK